MQAQLVTVVPTMLLDYANRGAARPGAVGLAAHGPFTTMMAGAIQEAAVVTEIIPPVLDAQFPNPPSEKYSLLVLAYQADRGAGKVYPSIDAAALLMASTIRLTQIA